MAVFLSYVLLICGALVLAGIGVLISFLGEKACLSRQCVGQAKFIKRAMDKNLNPCDDFYSFVCDNYPLFGTSILEEIETNQLKRLVDYLEITSDWEDDDRLEHIGKTLYQNCVNDTQLTLEGLRPLQRVIARIGGIPFLDPFWDSERSFEFNVIDNDLKHFFNGFNSIFVYNRIIRMRKDPSLKPKNETQAEIRQSLYQTFSIPPHFYTAEPYDPKNYLQYCIEFNDLYSTSLSINKTITDAEKKEIIEAAKFKIKLLKLADFSRNCSEQPFSFVELPYYKTLGKPDPKKESSTVRLNAYITRKAEPGITEQDYGLVTPNFEIYIDQLNELLDTVSIRVLAIYMGVEALVQITPFLPPEYKDIYEKYLENEKDKQNIVLSDKQLHCAKLVKDAMTTAITAQYLKDNPKNVNELGILNQLVHPLLREVRGVLKKIKWASREDHLKMVRLANRIKIVSPLPPRVYEKMMNKTAFDLFYLIMCSNDESTLETYLSVKTVKYIRNAQLLNIKSDTSSEPYDYTIFHDDYDIFETEIYFQRDYNMIVVPMAYLFYPSLDSLWPKYLSYGGLAIWIAHKVIQTVGYSNVLYPEIKPEAAITQSWWKEDTILGYKTRRECAFQEYNEYLKPFNIQSNDPNCLDYTLYTAAAVQAAYFAYKEDTRMRFFVEPRIPYLAGYTVDQIFFIKFASSFCRFYGGKNVWYTKETDSSRVSPNFTVLYSLRNFQHFSEAFECEKKEKMRKAEPCEMWTPVIKSTE